LAKSVRFEELAQLMHVLEVGEYRHKGEADKLLEQGLVAGVVTVPSVETANLRLDLAQILLGIQLAESFSAEVMRKLVSYLPDQIAGS
jgi:hypothetical protein